MLHPPFPQETKYHLRKPHRQPKNCFSLHVWQRQTFFNTFRHIPKQSNVLIYPTLVYFSHLNISCVCTYESQKRASHPLDVSQAVGNCLTQVLGTELQSWKGTVLFTTTEALSRLSSSKLNCCLFIFSFMLFGT